MRRRARGAKGAKRDVAGRCRCSSRRWPTCSPRRKLRHRREQWHPPAARAQRRNAQSRLTREAARDDQAVLRRLSQRSHEDRRSELPGDHGSQRWRARGSVREGGAQDARPRDAAAGCASAEFRRGRLAGGLARDNARSRADAGAPARQGRAAPPEPQGIHERRSRSAGRGLRRRHRCCRQTTLPKASTTSRTRCRCRRRSSSSTCSPRASLR